MAGAEVSDRHILCPVRRCLGQVLKRKSAHGNAGSRRLTVLNNYPQEFCRQIVDRPLAGQAGLPGDRAGVDRWRQSGTTGSR
jgi:hypothetical protein